MSKPRRFTANEIEQMSRTILVLVNSDRPQEEIIKDIVVFMQRKTGMEAIGLRLLDGLDYPYYFTRGFDLGFVEKEKYLCQRDQEGRIMLDTEGNACLECMCGNVIEGRTDPAFPFFTEGGSFFTNSTTDLLAATTEEDRQARTRDRCNGEGYESVALIPLRADDMIHGLLQLNDSQRDMFCLETVTYLEKVASSIAVLFVVKQATDPFSQQRKDVKRLMLERRMLLRTIADCLSVEAPGE
jgi:hypothetical protein